MMTVVMPALLIFMIMLVLMIIELRSDTICFLLHPPSPHTHTSLVPSVAARKRGELHTDLTAIVTLSRGCEALQQKVDDYYRQVRIIII
jgi:hypothetical protein